METLDVTDMYLLTDGSDKADTYQLHPFFVLCHAYSEEEVVQGIMKIRNVGRIMRAALLCVECEKSTLDMENVCWIWKKQTWCDKINDKSGRE